jgi:hypothetical protein
MKRALAVIAAAGTLTVVLAGCGTHGARAGNHDQAPVPAAATVNTTSGRGGAGANPAATGLSGVDSDLSSLDSSLSDTDSQLNQADQAADADN